MTWREIYLPFSCKRKYYCDEYGQIMSKSKNGSKRIVKGGKQKTGLVIDIIENYVKGQHRRTYKKHRFTIASLVLSAFRKKPPGKQAYHINGNVFDNRIVNITWRSKKEIGFRNQKEGRINKINSETRFKP